MYNEYILYTGIILIGNLIFSKIIGVMLTLIQFTFISEHDVTLWDQIRTLVTWLAHDLQYLTSAIQCWQHVQLQTFVQKAFTHGKFLIWNLRNLLHFYTFCYFGVIYQLLFKGCVVLYASHSDFYLQLLDLPHMTYQTNSNWNKYTLKSIPCNCVCFVFNFFALQCQGHQHCRITV